MLDSELVIIIADVLEKAIAASYPGLVVPVVQKAQPTSQGTVNGPSVYFEKLFDDPRHWPMTKFGQVDGVFKERTTQLYESVFQISSLLWQDPNAAVVITASDIANQIYMYLTLPSVIAELRAKGIGYLRITRVSNDKFENDDHRFEAHPSFNWTITNDRTIEVAIPTITTFDGEAFPV